MAEPLATAPGRLPAPPGDATAAGPVDADAPRRSGAFVTAADRRRYALVVAVLAAVAVLAGFTLTCQTGAVARIDACRDLNGQRFGFLHATVTMTFGARIFNQRTATMTVRTGLLHREEALAHLHLTGTVTGWAGLWLSPRFRTAAVANVTLFQRRNTDLFSDAAHRFFQRQLHVVA